jgi:hypothetical protein
MLRDAAPPLLMPGRPLVRLVWLGILLAALVYVVCFWTSPPVEDPQERPSPPLAIEVPHLDSSILLQVKDNTRDERLRLEPEPLRHLLEASLSISPPVASALGMPERMLDVAEVQRQHAQLRGRYLWCKGLLADLQGPKGGHPVAGYSIWEATLRLADGNFVLFTFSLPPEPGIEVGTQVRAEGFLLQLRDQTFPVAVDSAPLLVGPRLLRAYADWPPVEVLDPALLATVHDAHLAGSDFETDASKGIDADQAPPLWHLGAYARRRADTWTLQQWRTRPALVSKEQVEDLLHGKVERGTPMRLLGSYVQARCIEAAVNPAGIQHWSEVWVQVPELRGKTIPVWIPDRAPVLPRGANLELRAYYYKHLVYDTEAGGTAFTCVFVAPRLDLFQMAPHPIAQQLGLLFAAVVGLGILGIVWLLHRDRQRSRAFEDHLIARRRKRRAAATP